MIRHEPIPVDGVRDGTSLMLKNAFIVNKRQHPRKACNRAYLKCKSSSGVSVRYVSSFSSTSVFPRLQKRQTETSWLMQATGGKSFANGSNRRALLH